ncbi:hypothetical protein DW095_09165 [Bacteroides sp. AM07-16]|nr:hypothetical protein DW095_09165 [Bacteroides sp. AM07-16]
MRMNKYLFVGMLAVCGLCSCSNDEDPIDSGSAKSMEISAGIGATTRAVIDAGYSSDLPVSFGRLDNPSGNTAWDAAINAVRAGGSNNTSVTFGTTQTYSDKNGESALIGFYPQASFSSTTNPAKVAYTITGDEDIMATELQKGTATNVFQPFTFQHLLTQLQFKCVGSSDAVNKWTKITSITVKEVPTALELSIDRVTGASLAVAANPENAGLPILNCPEAVVSTDPKVGYLMLYPTEKMGTADAAISLVVKATYENIEKELTVPINNIADGVKAGQSHMITLNFTVTGEITVEAGIAEWQPGNGGGSTIVPGN